MKYSRTPHIQRSWDWTVVETQIHLNSQRSEKNPQVVSTTNFLLGNTYV